MLNTSNCHISLLSLTITLRVHLVLKTIIHSAELEKNQASRVLGRPSSENAHDSRED